MEWVKFISMQRGGIVSLFTDYMSIEDVRSISDGNIIANNVPICSFDTSSAKYICCLVVQYKTNTKMVKHTLAPPFINRIKDVYDNSHLVNIFKIEHQIPVDVCVDDTLIVELLRKIKS